LFCLVAQGSLTICWLMVSSTKAHRADEAKRNPPMAALSTPEHV
jgi:hypothetical protein